MPPSHHAGAGPGGRAEAGYLRPDALDSARVMALALGAVAAAGGLAQAVPSGGEVWNLLLHAAFLTLPLLYARFSGLGAWRANGFGPLRARQVGLILLASLGSLWLLKGLDDAQKDLLQGWGAWSAAEQEIRAIEKEVQSRIDLFGPWAVGALVLAPALCEETLFRGLVLRGFALRWGPVPAVLCTSFLFAVVHGKLVQLVPMAGLGIYFGAVVWLTGSLWAGMIAHAVNNLAVVVLMAEFGRDVEAWRAPWWMLLPAALLFGLAMALLAGERRFSGGPAGIGPGEASC